MNVKLQQVKNVFKIFLIVIPCFALVWKLSPFELSNEYTELIVKSTLLFTFQIFVFLFINLLMYESVRREAIYVKILVLTVIDSVLIIVLIIFFFGASFCGNINEAVFIAKSNSNVKIIKRHFDCGAYDSESPIYTYHKTKELTSYLRIAETIDIQAIDSNQWIVVNKTY